MIGLLRNEVLALKWGLSTLRIKPFSLQEFIHLLFILTLVPILKVIKKKGKFEDAELVYSNALVNQGYAFLEPISDSLMSEIDLEFSKNIYSVIKPNLPHKRSSVSQLLSKKIIRELGIEKICKDYLNTEKIICTGVFEYRPVLNIVRNKYDEASRFHRDLEGVNQLKLFIYLSDVSSQNGCHQLIPKTHKPKKFSDLKYMERYQNFLDIGESKELLNIIAPKGFSFLEDTFCWHRAKPIEEGYRLMLILSFYHVKDFLAFRKILVPKDYFIMSENA